MKTHGEIRSINGKRVASSEYRSWQMMKNRCLNTKASDYKHYGGRGITMCNRWLSFENFLEDMGRRPTPLHSIDRVDPYGNYEPDNCKWSTREEQSRNRTYSSTKAWLLAEQLGVKAMTAHHMIWQVRAKDRGDTKWFRMSAEKEQQVRRFLDGSDISGF